MVREIDQLAVVDQLHTECLISVIQRELWNLLIFNSIKKFTTLLVTETYQGTRQWLAGENTQCHFDRVVMLGLVEFKGFSLFMNHENVEMVLIISW